MTVPEPRRVVIAEDEALIRMDLAEMLAEEGYDVVGQAADGARAIELAEEHRPDLVILDVKMPVLDGIAAAERIARDRIAPVVILTAFSQRELVERARDAGAMAYLVKPFSRTDLVPAIEIAVSRFAELGALETEVADLGEQLAARKAVDRAKAVLQKQLGLSEPDAFRWIQKTAMDLRRSMREVAEGVVEHGVTADLRLDPARSTPPRRSRPTPGFRTPWHVTIAKLCNIPVSRGETDPPEVLACAQSLDNAAHPRRNPDEGLSHGHQAQPADLCRSGGCRPRAHRVRQHQQHSTSTAGAASDCTSGQKLAFLGATTGPAGALGQNMVGGIKLALDEYNKANPDCKVGLEGLRLAGRPGEGDPAGDPDRPGHLDRRPDRSRASPVSRWRPARPSRPRACRRSRPRPPT